MTQAQLEAKIAELTFKLTYVNGRFATAIMLELKLAQDALDELTA